MKLNKDSINSFVIIYFFLICLLISIIYSFWDKIDGSNIISIINILLSIPLTALLIYITYLLQKQQSHNHLLPHMVLLKNELIIKLKFMANISMILRVPVPINYQEMSCLIRNNFFENEWIELGTFLGTKRIELECYFGKELTSKCTTLLEKLYYLIKYSTQGVQNQREYNDLIIKSTDINTLYEEIFNIINNKIINK